MSPNFTPSRVSRNEVKRSPHEARPATPKRFPFSHFSHSSGLLRSGASGRTRMIAQMFPGDWWCSDTIRISATSRFVVATMAGASPM